MNFSLIGYVENDKMQIWSEDKNNQRILLSTLYKNEGSGFLLNCNKILGIAVCMTTVKPDWLVEEKKIDPIAPSGGQRYQAPKI